MTLGPDACSPSAINPPNSGVPACPGPWDARYLLILLFFPIHFRPSGVYRGRGDDLWFYDVAGRIIEKGGLIVPLAFLAGVVVSILLFWRMAHRWTAFRSLKGWLLSFLPLVLASLVLGLAGVLSSRCLAPGLLTLQSLSGLAGVCLAIWAFHWWKLDFELFCGRLSLLYLANILIHVAWSYHLIGMETFGRQIVFETPFWGIYQLLSYWPAVVAMVFLFALPYWRKKIVATPLFLVVGYYLYFINVRTVVLYFLFGLLLFLAFFSEKKRLARIFLGLIVAFLVFLAVMRHPWLKRFRMPDLGKRDIYWFMTLDHIRESLWYLVYGTLFEAKTILPQTDWSLGKSLGVSYHNQYLEYMKQGGMLLLGSFLYFLTRFLKEIWGRVRTLYRSEGMMVGWGLVLIFLDVCLNFNSNTPLRVTFPAVMTWFFWTGYFIHLNQRAEALGEQEGSFPLPGSLSPESPSPPVQTEAAAP
jgi:hypothetical protein